MCLIILKMSLPMKRFEIYNLNYKSSHTNDYSMFVQLLLNYQI